MNIMECLPEKERTSVAMEEKDDILLVGAQPENSRELEDLLKGLEFELMWAESEEEALQLCEDESFVLIILVERAGDVFATASRLRAGATSKDIPILFVFGEERCPEREEKVLGLGDADYIFNPLRPVIFEQKVRHLVKWYKTSRQAHELEASNTELARYHEQMREFVAIVAHDLRAPLGKLINISEVLMAGVEPDELLTFYKIIQKTSKRGFDLVNDILDLTAVESGQVKLDFGKCDISQLALQIVAEMSFLAREKGIELVNNITESMEVKADGRRISQVLGNLIANAVKFTPRSGTVTLDARPWEDGVQVQVNDTGVGIPEDTIEALFQKHKKVSTPGTDGERGTGYGLPLSQELIRAHASVISVRSEMGKGSSFSFILPRWKR